MTITTLTTFNITIRVTDSDTRLFVVYGRALGQDPATDGSRYFDLTNERDLSLSIDIDGREYYASGVIVPAESGVNTSELMIVWVKTAEPATYHLFTLYADYSAWGVKMDVIRIVGDTDSGIDEFLKLSPDRRRSLLGLS